MILHFKNIVFMLIFGSLFSCSSSEAQVKNSTYRLLLKTIYKKTVPLLSVQELAKNKDKYILLDAREIAEYEVSHIENAVFVGYDNYKANRVSEIDKKQPILVYCSVGYRSERIGEKLQKMCFEEVYNLNGGIFEWLNQDKKVVDKQEQKTKKIHAFSKTWGIWAEKGEKVY